MAASGPEVFQLADRAEIIALDPRPDFKHSILAAFTEGITSRPETTFGNVQADVLERYVPGDQARGRGRLAG